MMKNKFILCGLTGWCLEVFWTGLIALQRRQMKLEGRSSIWMFPIYGMAAFLAPLSRLLKGMSVDDAIERMDGIRCGMKRSSCPDQLAQALKQMRDGAQS